MRTPPDYPLPTVHTNGTSRKDLQEGYDRAADALHNFIRAWSTIEFNARDYYVQEPGAWGKARDARDQINDKLREIRDYIDNHREHLYQ
jgi:hypothetical protein